MWDMTNKQRTLKELRRLGRADVERIARRFQIARIHNYTLDGLRREIMREQANRTTPTR